MVELEPSAPESESSPQLPSWLLPGIDGIVVAGLTLITLGFILELYEDLPHAGMGTDLPKWLYAAIGIEGGNWGAARAGGRPIVMPALMSLFAADRGEIDTAGLYLGWVFTALTPGVLYLSTRYLLGRWPALFGAIAIMGVEPLIFGAGRINSQSLLNLLLAGSLGLIPWLTKGQWWRALLGGAYLALMALTKEQGLPYLLLLPCLMLFPWPFLAGLKLPARVGRVGLMLALGWGIFLGAEVWQASLTPHMESKSTLPLRDLMAISEGDMPRYVYQIEAETRASPGYVSRGREGIFQRDSRYHRYFFLSFHRLKDLGTPYYPIALMGLFGLGLILVPFSCLSWARWIGLYLFLCLQPLWAAFLIHFNPLHLSFTLPLLGALACLLPAALMSLVRGEGEPHQRVTGSDAVPWRARGRFWLSMFLGFGLCSGLYAQKHKVWRVPIHEMRRTLKAGVYPGAKTVGLWLADNSESEALVSATSGLVHLYARRQELIIPNLPMPGPGCRPPGDTMAAVPIYFVLNSQDGALHLPGLNLREPEDLPSYYFELVHVVRWNSHWTAVTRLKVENYDDAILAAKEAGHLEAFESFCRHISNI